MTDNFLPISKYIDESFKNNEDMFFHISVMIRHKDVEWFPKGKNNNSRTIYSVNVSNSTELNDQYKLISTLCDSLNARAYINLVPKSYKKSAGEALRNATNAFTTQNYKGLQSSWSKGVAAGSIKEHSLYLVDIDDEYINKVHEIHDFINFNCKPLGYKVKLKLPSKSGWHLLCEKFDTKEFNKEYPEVGVKKNAMTILYSY